MKRKRTTYLALLLSAAFLASCGGHNNSQRGSSSGGNANASESGNSSGKQEGDTLTFSGAISLLESLARNEGTASAETYHEKRDNNSEKHDSSSSVTTLDKKLTLFSDSSSVGTGTLSKTLGDGTVTSTTLKEATEARTDRIEVSSGNNQDFSMLYHAIDYKDDSLTNANYQDSADRTFIFDYSNQAATYGLSDGEFILKDNIAYHSSYQLTETLAQWISVNLAGNAYVSQTGKDSFEKSQQKDGTYLYAVGVSYGLNDGENDYYYIQDVSFTVDEEERKLLSFSVSFETHIINKSDSTDTSDEVYEVSGTATYGTKGENNVSDRLIPYNYFLQDITEVALLDAERKEVDPKGVTVAAHYLFAKPKAYTPSLAMGINENVLSRDASSDPTVVQKTDDGYFEIMSTGTTKLTFSYFGLDLSTKVWKQKTISIDVAVGVTLPEAISAGSLLSDKSDSKTYTYDQLKTGHTYVCNVNVTPSQASQEFTASVDDPTLMRVSIVKAGEASYNAELTALKAGTVKVTFTSTVDSNVTVTYTFKIEDDISGDSGYGLIVGKTFRFTNSLYASYTEDMTFHSKEAGTLVCTFSKETVSIDFTYTLSNSSLTFVFDEEEVDSKQLANNVFDSGVLSSDGKSIDCESSTTYKSFSFSLVR